MCIMSTNFIVENIFFYLLLLLKENIDEKHYFHCYFIIETMILTEQ